MNGKQITNYWYRYLHENYPFIQWEFRFKKESTGAKFTFIATNLVTDTTYSISIDTFTFTEYYSIEYVKQNIKSLVEKIKDESTKELLNRMEKLNETT